MAETDEEVQYLQESRLHYGDSRPPFARNSLPSRSNNSTVRLADTGEIQAVHHRCYPTAERSFAYATIRIEGLIYIICALPYGWSRGDSTYHRGGCRDWFVWQGLDHQFRGPLFDGPVAKSAGRVGNIARGKVGKTAKSEAAPATDISPSQPRSNRRRQVRSIYRRDSSPPFFEGSPEPNQSFSHAAPLSDTVGLTRLTPSQEYATWLHVKIYKDPEKYYPLRLSSARPGTDPDGAVTNESLFEKITDIAHKTRPSIGEIIALEATFPTDLADKSGDSGDTGGIRPVVAPVMIVRGEEDTFECFQSHVLAFDELNDKVSWYVVLRSGTE